MNLSLDSGKSKAIIIDIELKNMARLGSKTKDILDNLASKNVGKEKKIRIRIGIRELVREDLNAGFLQSLDNLVPRTSRLNRDRAKKLMREINSNELHRVFVAVISEGKKNSVVGTITLLVEPKFIYNGGRVGHIEDVSVRKGFERLGIGRRLVFHAVGYAKLLKCRKLVLDCSDGNIRFYERMGFSYQDNCMKKFLN